MTKIEVLETIQGMSIAEVEVLKALGDRVLQRESEAKRLNLSTVSNSYRLTLEEQHDIFPELETDESVIEKMWWTLTNLRHSSIQRLKGSSVHCDVWILKFSRNIHDSSVYVLIDRNMADEYKALAA